MLVDKPHIGDIMDVARTQAILQTLLDQLAAAWRQGDLDLIADTACAAQRVSDDLAATLSTIFSQAAQLSVHAYDNAVV